MGIAKWNTATKNEWVWNANETEEIRMNVKKENFGYKRNIKHAKTMQEALKVAPLFDYANTRWLL